MSSASDRRRLSRVVGMAAALLGAATVAIPPVSAAPAADCEVAPRPVAEFVLPADPGGGERSRLIIEDAAQAPAGTPASAADAAAAQAFAELYTGCQNAGDLRRLAALSSDAMFGDTLAARVPLRLPPENPFQALLATALDSTARDAEEAAAHLARDLAAPVPLSPPISDVEARDVRVLPDGRLGAILVQDGQPTEFQMYARVDGQLTLDERMDFR